MKLPDVALSMRVIFVATLLLVILAVAFPVKEAMYWGNSRAGEEAPAVLPPDFFDEKKTKGEWTIRHEGWVPVMQEEYAGSGNSVIRLPSPTPGPIGRAFILNQRQREIKLWAEGSVIRTSYYKEVPSLARIAFDVLFVILCGLGATYISHAWRVRSIDPSNGARACESEPLREGNK